MANNLNFKIGSPTNDIEAIQSNAGTLYLTDYIADNQDSNRLYIGTSNAIGGVKPITTPTPYHLSINMNGVKELDKYTGSENETVDLIINNDGVYQMGSEHAAVHYALCNTASDVAEKATDIMGFVLTPGARIHIKFLNTNTAEAPKLNINQTGAQNIDFNNKLPYLIAGNIYTFIFDGTNYALLDEYHRVDGLGGESSEVYNDSTNIASGDYAHAEGRGTIARGNVSHAEGGSDISFLNETEIISQEIVSNLFSVEGMPILDEDMSVILDYTSDSPTGYGIHTHAEGTKTIAYGESSHAEGIFTSSQGRASHSEGNTTLALGDYSHSEGCLTGAFGIGAHSEGNMTFAYGNYSHAEGYGEQDEITATFGIIGTTANGIGAHAEGINTIANGKGAHAEGYLTGAGGEYSHAEGSWSAATGRDSHAEGGETKANGTASHSEGSLTVANGGCSHAEGQGTHAEGYCSHVEGNFADANGDCSHAEGERTQANGNYSHAEGEETIAKGDSSHVEGAFTEAVGYSSHAEGQRTLAKGIGSHAEGQGNSFQVSITGAANATTYTLSATNSNIKIRQIIRYQDIYAVITAYNSSVPSITVDRTLSETALTNASATIYTLAAIGDGSHVEGCNTVAIGNYSHAEGELSTANGIGAHAEGVETIAQGFYSHAEGGSTQAIGIASHAEGSNTIANGIGAHAEGQLTQAIGQGTHAGGYKTIANCPFQTVIGKFNSTDYLTPNPLFIVGDGKNEDNRNNALELGSGGDSNEIKFAVGNLSNAGFLFETDYVESTTVGIPDYYTSNLILTGGSSTSGLMFTQLDDMPLFGLTSQIDNMLNGNSSNIVESEILMIVANNRPSILLKSGNENEESQIVMMVEDSVSYIEADEFRGTLKGNADSATTATNATNVYVNNTTTATKYYVVGSSLTSAGNSALYRAYNTSGSANTTGVYFQGSTGVLYGAAWNDYAEFRKTEEKIEPGRAVIETGKGDLVLATERLQPGAEIVSDTFGFAIGETDECQTPIAATGRVLAYPYEDRESYKAGDAVCAGPNGTVSKMTREEIREYPDRIIGTVSEIPEYETWGQTNVPVNGRIWIRIR